MLHFMQIMNNKINWDAIGITTSLACAIHCALLPLFFTSLPVLGINILDSLYFEIAMACIAFAIGIYSLYHGYKKHHRSFLPMAVFVVGFVFLLLKLFFVQYENWLLIPAVAGLIVAHLINYNACRIRSHAHKANCDHK